MTKNTASTQAANKASEAAVNPENTALALWDRVRTPDPKYTKKFSRGGGFSGTAINATYLARVATGEFGPIGIGWGLDIVEEKFIDGAPIIVNDKVVCHEKIHVLQVRLWYKQGDQTGNVTQFGQTTFVGKNKYGPFTDEEAPKKSLTDAMSKCLSLLGFASDVFLGLFDDNKYVNDAQEAYADQKPVVSVNGAQGDQGPSQGDASPASGKPFEIAPPPTRQQAAPSSATSGVDKNDGIPAAERKILDQKIASLNTVDDISRIQTGIAMATTLFKTPAAIEAFKAACQQRIALLDPVPF